MLIGYKFIKSTYYINIYMILMYNAADTARSGALGRNPCSGCVSESHIPARLRAAAPFAVVRPLQDTERKSVRRNLLLSGSRLESPMLAIFMTMSVTGADTRKYFNSIICYDAGVET